MNPTQGKILTPNQQAFSASALLMAISLALIYIIDIYFSTQPPLSEYIKPPSSTTISITAAAYFLTLTLVALIREKWYWAILPIVIMTTPNAINDILPSFYMSKEGAVDTPSFSLITHIDAFLISGLLRYSSLTRSIKIRSTGILVTAALLAGWVTFMLLLGIHSELLGATLTGLFQLRYFIMLMLLFMLATPHRHMSTLLLSMLGATILVAVEAAAYTQINGLERLTSGNFGTNPLGHLLAAMTVAALASGRLLDMRLKIAFFLMATVLIAFNETRFSFVAMLLGIGAMLYISTESATKKLTALIALTFLVATFTLFTPPGQSILAGLSSVLTNLSDLNELPRTEESSSMITRLYMWVQTTSMILDHWISGLGPGQWAFHKEAYDIPFPGILDPHSDLLVYVVSYGFPGLIFFFIIFILPLWRAYKARNIAMRTTDHTGDSLIMLSSFVLTMLIAGLTNAVTWKHQIAALVYLSSIALLTHPLITKHQFSKARV